MQQQLLPEVFQVLLKYFQGRHILSQICSKTTAKRSFQAPFIFFPSNVVQKTLWTLVKASRAISGCFEGFWGEVHYVQYFLIFFCHLPFDVIVSALQLH